MSLEWLPIRTLASELEPTFMARALDARAINDRTPCANALIDHPLVIATNSTTIGANDVMRIAKH
jgi:hypothetical protein